MILGRKYDLELTPNISKNCEFLKSLRNYQQRLQITQKSNKKNLGKYGPMESRAANPNPSPTQVPTSALPKERVDDLLQTKCVISMNEIYHAPRT